MARNRIIYQSEALFVSPNATGAHFSCSALMAGTGTETAAVISIDPIGIQQDPKATLSNVGTSSLTSASTAGELDLYNLSGALVAKNSVWDQQAWGNSWNEMFSANALEGGKNEGAKAQSTAFDKVVLNNDPATNSAAIEALSVATLESIDSSSTNSTHQDIYNLSGALRAKYPLIDNDGDGDVVNSWNAVNKTNGVTFFNDESAWATFSTNDLGATGWFIDPFSGTYEAGAPENGTCFYSSVSNWEAALNANKAIHEAEPTKQLCTGILVQPYSGTYENLVQQIHRVQSANYSFTINRTDVNTFGQLARIDSIALEPPTVSLDFSYYPTDGLNERNLGFYIQGADDKGPNMGASSLNTAKGHLQDDSAGKNFFILTTPEGTDAFNTTEANANKSVISLGNGFLSDYTIEGAVGGMPTVSASVELFNAKSDVGTYDKDVPAVTLDKGAAITDTSFTLGHSLANRGDANGASPGTGDAGVSCLRPGDITMEIPEDLAIFNKVSGVGSAHIQNFNLSIPLARTPIDKLGTRFAFSRVVDFPVVSTLSVSALVSEVGVGNLASILDDCNEHDVRITMKSNLACGVGAATDSIIIDFKGARIDSESMSSDIGSNKSVDLTFTTQIGGPEDNEHGVLISGANRSDLPTWYGTPNI
jgi:hypothetical protein